MTGVEALDRHWTGTPQGVLVVKRLAGVRVQNWTVKAWGPCCSTRDDRVVVCYVVFPEVGNGVGVSQRLMGISEIAQLLGVSRQRAHQLAQSEDFPKPIAVLAAGKIWEAKRIEAWAQRRRDGRTKHEG